MEENKSLSRYEMMLADDIRNKKAGKLYFVNGTVEDLIKVLETNIEAQVVSIHYNNVILEIPNNDKFIMLKDYVEYLSTNLKLCANSCDIQSLRHFTETLVFPSCDVSKFIEAVKPYKDYDLRIQSLNGAGFSRTFFNVIDYGTHFLILSDYDNRFYYNEETNQIYSFYEVIDLR